MFRKILIANRGEIACRVIKTAKKMGINTVAIYSNIDSNAKHVLMADSGYYVGENKSSESYLKMEKIIEVAKISGAEAIHPGYGFLSENCHFVELCEKNNIKFIGPPSSAIKAMGSKIESKKIMENAMVPIVPGYFGENQDKLFLLETAKKIGYPIMIKADLGGGGKGMRIVRNEREFEEALSSAQAEAIKSFGSAKILMEKYLESSRHIEVQVFGDHHGNYVHLFERDCTIQRRHQKVIEEAPSYLEESIRSQLCNSAVLAAKAVGYTNAGTVEFIYDIPSKQFYFMEMNTRLQVEHPISEMITGQDFVEWQLIVASGGKLPLKQEEIGKIGHAIECRIYSEDPANNFLPGSGKIHYINEPSHRDESNENADENVRIETGIRKGDEVSIFYDPMISKLVVYAKNRDLCIKKTIGCLENYQILGLPTNIKFLQSILKHETFKNWDFDTNFISKNFNELMSFCEERVKPEDILSTVLCKVLNEKKQYTDRSKSLTNPWNILDNFRVNYTDDRIFNLVSEDEKYEVKLKYLSENSYQVVIVGLDKTMDIVYPEVTVKSLDDYDVQINIKNNSVFKAKYFIDDSGNIRVLKSDGTVSHIDFAIDDYGISEDHHESVHSNVKSPMPCTISKIFVKVGDEVDKGEKLISLEAMKMEHVIKAPKRTTIKAIYVKEAKFVEASTVLIEFNE